MKVKYTGPSDVQEFGAKDFRKADVEQTKLTFPNGKAVDVSDEVGQMLIKSEGIFGDYSFEEAEDDEAEERSSEEDPDDKSGVEMTETGSKQENTGPPTPPPTGSRGGARKTTATPPAGSGTP